MIYCTNSIVKRERDCSLVSEAVRLKRRIHGITNSDVRAQGREIELKIEGDVVSATLSRRSRYILEAVRRIGLLPFPPHAIQSSMMKIE